MDFGLFLAPSRGANASLNTASVSAAHPGSPLEGGFVGADTLAHVFAHEVVHLFGARVRRKVKL